MNIYDLGLVYTIDINAENEIDVIMTLTAPGCPVAGEMPGWVADAIEPLPGVKQVDVATDLGAALGHGHDVGRGPAGTGVHVGATLRGCVAEMQPL